MSISPPFRSSAEVPEIVYHYTNATAFLAIAQGRRLHAGSTRGMNDRHELQTGRDSLREIAEADGSGTTADQVWRLVTDPEFSNIDDEISVYVLCASSMKDDTAQWANYADDGRGYAIGFRTDHELSIETSIPERKTGLSDSLNGYGSKLSAWVPVLYDTNAIEAEFRQLFQWIEEYSSNIDALRRKYKNADPVSPEAIELFMEEQLFDFNVAARAHSVIHRIKSGPWRAEHEYRRVAVLNSGSALKRFKASSTGITSHVNLIAKTERVERDVQFVPRSGTDLQLDSLPIAEVVCGPRIGTEGHLDVKAMLAENGLAHTTVGSSDALLR